MVFQIPLRGMRGFPLQQRQNGKFRLGKSEEEWLKLFKKKGGKGGGGMSIFWVGVRGMGTPPILPVGKIL